MESVVTFLQDVVPQVISLLRVFSLFSSWEAFFFVLQSLWAGPEGMVKLLETNSDLNNSHG